ncbi:tight adherence pilus pseudopilin TadF [Ferrimonas kyonanensis]|uniref:tight adherence pilus pseudopilin TadF n=1 Tax=Ferrimonas kyonanensis TaxID=364763 RepID=UPI0003F60C17|nr:tight adherence pilus pseudopilin TadF [Ferrimonas kyonanensis]
MHNNHQRGAFAIEMAFVLAFLAMLFLFSTDLSQQLLNRTRLDRVSYSLVNVVKERTRFYAGREPVSQQDFDQLTQIAARLLARESVELSDSFGIALQSLVDGQPVRFSKSYLDALPCLPEQDIQALTELVPENDAGKRYPLYQVTLCLNSQAWFDKAAGDHLLASSSTMVGR